MKPDPHEGLLLYLVVSPTALSVVLIQEINERQHPMYYASRALLDAKTRYMQLDKLALALVMVSRKLKPYFQVYLIVVVYVFLLKVILLKPDISRR